MSENLWLLRSRRWPLAILVGALCLAGGGALLSIGGSVSRSPSDVQGKAGKLLADAHSQTDAALEKHLKRVRAVFQRGRRGAAAFADDTLSWSGKWALVKGTLGIGEGDAHAAFLTESFAKHVFTSQDLKAALQGAVKGYLADLDAIENQLLVRLRADLADSQLGRGGLPALASDRAFAEEYRRLARAITPTLKRDAGMEVGRQVAGIVAIDVATPVVLRIVEVVAAELGVEAGILGAGAASGVATLGVGLVVGIVANQVIGWVLKQAGYDPAEEIAGKVCASLDRVESLLIDGTPQKAGLRQELQRLGKARSNMQDGVVTRLLKEGGAS